MSKIAPFLFSEELDEEEMTDIIFKYRNQTKRFEADGAGCNIKTLDILITRVRDKESSDVRYLREHTESGGH